MAYKEHRLFEILSKQLARLPGLGPRSARRVLLYLLNRKDDELKPLITQLQTAADNILHCGLCGALDFIDPCIICGDNGRDKKKICVVEQMSDLWAIERSETYHGLYHVLGGVLSPIDNIGPDELNLKTLASRCAENSISEVILATNVTLDGQTTAHYIAELLQQLPIKITRLAHGVPAGGELDYMDEGTIFAAFKSRRDLD